MDLFGHSVSFLAAYNALSHEKHDIFLCNSLSENVHILPEISLESAQVAITWQM